MPGPRVSHLPCLSNPKSAIQNPKFQMPTVVVTGASQGIGAAVAEAFAAEPGARLALVARSREKLEALAGRCRARGAEAVVHVCDVTDEAAVGAAAGAIVGQWGAPDVLVNNAGLFEPGPLDR